MSGVRLNHFKNFLFSTDLEPDDVISIMMFLHKIGEHEKVSKFPIKIAFLVGEGDSAIKVARMQKLIDEYKRLKVIKDVKITIIQGYSEFNSAQKDFVTEGTDLLSKEEIDKAKSTYCATKEMTKSQIKAFLENKPTLVISLKPMRELQDLVDENSEIFKDHILACTGSYNFRSTFWTQDKKDTSKKTKLVALLNAFHQTYIYESYSTTKENSISPKNAAEFFALISKEKDNLILSNIATFIGLWKTHQLANDRNVFLPTALSELNTLLKEESRQKFTDALNSDYVESTESELLALLNTTKAANKDDKLIGSLRHLERIMKKWKFITQVPIQSVNSDPGLIAVLTGECDDVCIAQPVSISFNGEYTALSVPTDESRTFVYLPERLSLSHFLEWRSKQDETPVPILEYHQNALFKRIVKVVTESALVIDKQFKAVQSTSSSFGFFAGENKEVKDELTQPKAFI